MKQQHYVGLDISVKTTTVCVVDPNGAIAHRVTVESHPDVIGEHLLHLGLTYARIGVEAGPLALWLYNGLGLSGPADDLCRDPSHACGTSGEDQQDRPQ